MKLYMLVNKSCEDNTYAMMELDDEQYEFLTNVFIKLNVNRSGQWQPEIYLTDNYSKYEVLEEWQEDASWIIEHNGKYYEENI